MIWVDFKAGITHPNDDARGFQRCRLPRLAKNEGLQVKVGELTLSKSEGGRERKGEKNKENK